MLLPLDKIKHILVIRPDAIGDMVLTLAAVKAIKKKYPDKKITVLASKYNARFIDHLDFIDNIIFDTFPKSFTGSMALRKMLKKENIDLALHFFAKPKTAWAAYFAGIPYHIGDKAKLGMWWIFRKYGLFYKSFNLPVHVVDYNFRLLKPLDITLDENATLDLPLPNGVLESAEKKLSLQNRDKNKPLVTIQVGVGAGNRPVTAEKYAEFINALREKKDVDICLTGFSEKEINVCNRINELTASTLILITDSPIKELMGLFKTSNVLVSVDTGPFHLGASVGVPQLAIFPSKKVRPSNWGPWRNKHFVVRESHTCKEFCPHENCPINICSDNLKVDDMVEKTVMLLDGKGIDSFDEQKNYWFEKCINVLITYDSGSKAHATALSGNLKTFGLRTYLEPIKSSSLFTTIKENNIGIIHNTASSGKLKLFLHSQKAIAHLHFSPLVVHGKNSFEKLVPCFDFYREQFEKKPI